MPSSDRITLTFCPVCRDGQQGYCDERCEMREPNGQPGHFPGQLETLSRNTPDRETYHALVDLVHVMRQFDNANGQVPAIWRES
jgi:hypothetical protein